ncbi:MAG: class I SAM-dependent RNA methyltransferase [Desulfamplus sp.]|nr:class I SAM-dependent RNA methyltransferase [Desulfamplus sp.]MBF0388893.1 class I SAM-dependent RNA methyltransferase [Desulfamplus sp.]
MLESKNRGKLVIRKRAGEHQRYASGFKYQQDSRYFAQIAENLSDEGVKELKTLGARDIEPAHTGIYFSAEKSDFYKINYTTRLISRVLAPLESFPCSDSDTLYKNAKKIKWELLISKKMTFSITHNVSDSNIDHSQFAALRLKDAIVDYFRERTGKRPNVDTLNPNVIINLHIRNNFADISLDASGGALHKRGYREESVAAPMQETIAAAIIRLSEWDGSIPLYDPMCGSGTLLCEALMMHCNIPASIFRKNFGFQRLPDYNPELWGQVKKEADANIKEISPNLIAGSDISHESINAAKTNLMGIHFGGSVSLEVKDFNDIESIKDSVIVANPPYGIRIGRDQDLKLFYKKLGDFLKQKCKGSKAFIYFGEPEYIKNMGLKASWKMALKAGGLDGRLVKYEMY